MKDYCDAAFSLKLRVLSFAAMVSVTLIHLGGWQLIEGDIPVGVIWFAHVSSCINHWAVPFFLMVAGFFFDRGLTRQGALTGSSYLALLKKKCGSLLGPYVLWGGVYGVLAVIPLRIMLNVQKGLPWCSGTLFGWTEPWKRAIAAFGLNTYAPVNGPLWFVRALLIIFLFAPLWYFLRMRFRAFLAVGALAFIGAFSTIYHGEWYESVSVFGLFAFEFKFCTVGWFLLGVLGSVYGIDSKTMPRWLLMLVACCFVATTCWSFRYEFGGQAIPRWWTFCDRFVPLLAVLFVWGLYDCLAQRIPCSLPCFVSLAFWCYAMHHPLVGYFGASMRLLVGRGPYAYLVNYWIGAALLIAFEVLVARSVSKTLPRVFRILNGGR